MNTGKKFEELFKKSAIEKGYDFTRLKDAGYVGDKSESRRFTSKNICDCILFGWGSIYYLELKSRAKSLRFDEVTQEKALMKKETFIQENIDKCRSAEAGVLVHFQQSNRVFYYCIAMTEQLKDDTGKKSFNVNDIENLADEHPAFCFELDMITPVGKRTERIDVERLFQ